MATTTTNYGFDVPTSSDLVKNGATAISTLGQDLDTFLFRPFTRNAVINGGMDIWQRGTSIAYGINTGVYTADRWTTLRTASPSGATVSRQASSLTGIQYCARVQRDSGNTSTSVMFFGTNLESADSYRFAGQTVTMSYYARAGANYSAASSALSAVLYTGTGSDQNFVTGFTGGASTGTGTATLTTSWQRFTITATIPSGTTQIALYYSMTPTGTAGANDYFEVTGVQLEVGNQASPFIRAGGTLQGELAACERYFIRYDSSSDASLDFATGVFLNSSLFRGTLALQTTMRSAPTAAFSAANLFQLTSSTNITPDSISLNTSSPKQACISFGIVAASGTAGYAGIMRANTSTSAFINLSAEL
jgi:hypothetical protein